MLRKGILNLPNLLTAFRIFLVPLVVVVLLTEFQFEKWLFLSREALAVGLFLVASLTDLLDGYLARRRGEVTTLGQLLDPIADKLLVSSVLISLVEIRLIAAVNQVVIPAGRLGKWKMVVEVIAICFIIWGNQKEWDWVLLTGRWLLYLVAAVALVSMAEYFVQFSRRIDLFAGGKGT